MKKELNYVAPSLEVIEVMVEAGFANSTETNRLGTSDFEEGEDLGAWS